MRLRAAAAGMHWQMMRKKSAQLHHCRCMQVAKMIVGEGDIVLIADTKGVKDFRSSDALSIQDGKTPLSVLVNGGTASAAEVLAGAVQDNGRGSVAGEPTFGKGLIQSVWRLRLKAAVGSASSTPCLSAVCFSSDIPHVPSFVCVLLVR